MISQEPPLLPTNELGISAINDIDDLNLNNYAKFIKTSGILVYRDGFYYVEDGLGNNIKISHFSYMPTSLDSLNAAINQYVEISVILHQFDVSTNSWVATYLFNSLQLIEKQIVKKWRISLKVLFMNIIIVFTVQVTI